MIGNLSDILWEVTTDDPASLERDLNAAVESPAHVPWTTDTGYG